MIFKIRSTVSTFRRLSHPQPSEKLKLKLICIPFTPFCMAIIKKRDTNNIWQRYGNEEPLFTAGGSIIQYSHYGNGNGGLSGN